MKQNKTTLVSYAEDAPEVPDGYASSYSAILTSGDQLGRVLQPPVAIDIADWAISKLS